MSTAAVKWFARQEIEDVTLPKLLRVLAHHADTSGLVAIGQAAIAADAGVKERATRTGLQLLVHFGIVSRGIRVSGKNGRSVDRMTLSLDRDFCLPKVAISDARRAGCPETLTTTSVPVAPSHSTGMAVPVDEAAPNSDEVDGLYIARARPLNCDAADVETLKAASARVWPEHDEWRARLTYKGISFDLGRHECRALAEAECEAKKADIKHSLTHEAEIPRERVTHLGTERVTGSDLMRLLDDPTLPSVARTRAQSEADFYDDDD